MTPDRAGYLRSLGFSLGYVANETGLETIPLASRAYPWLKACSCDECFSGFYCEDVDSNCDVAATTTQIPTLNATTSNKTSSTLSISPLPTPTPTSSGSIISATATPDQARGTLTDAKKTVVVTTSSPKPLPLPLVITGATEIGACPYDCHNHGTCLLGVCFCDQMPDERLPLSIHPSFVSLF